MSSCRPCECDPDGSVDDCSSLDGRCYCKPSVEGQSCDRCVIRLSLTSRMCAHDLQLPRQLLKSSTTEQLTPLRNTSVHVQDVVFLIMSHLHINDKVFITARFNGKVFNALVQTGQHTKKKRFKNNLSKNVSNIWGYPSFRLLGQ